MAFSRNMSFKRLSIKATNYFKWRLRRKITLFILFCAIFYIYLHIRIKPIKIEETILVESMNCKNGANNTNYFSKETSRKTSKRKREFHYFAAYYDTRTPGAITVRTFALSSGSSGPKYCTLYHEDSIESILAEKVAAKISDETEGAVHKTPKYHTYMFSCNVTSTNIKSMSLTDAPCDLTESRKAIEIQQEHENTSTEFKINIALCVKNIHLINNPYQIIEFLELQSLLGVEYFHVYKIGKISSRVLEVLYYYKYLGVLNLIPWDIPIRNTKEFLEELEVVVNNDCIYRSRNKYEIVLMHQITEFIIPRREEKDLKELLHMLYSHNNYHLEHTYASYSFYECYFCLKPSDNVKIYPHLFAIKRDRRHMCLKLEMDLEWWQNVAELKVYQIATRKSIVHPSRVVLIAKNRAVQKIYPYKKEFKVPTYYASLNHYEYDPKGNWKCNIRDDIVGSKFNPAVKSAVERVCLEIGMAKVP